MMWITSRIFSLFLTLLILLSGWSFSEVHAAQDVKIYREKVKLSEALDLQSRPINQIIEIIAKSFIDTPYESNALENKDREVLIIHLSSLDCTTFVENVLALSINIKQKGDFEHYKDNLKRIRYREGDIENYTSRLHYFSDWIFDNTQKKIIKDVTQEIGGDLIQFYPNFMSQDPDKCPSLKRHPEFLPLIAKQELAIKKRNYFYIPKRNVKGIEHSLHDGDILAITTNKKGLDIAHVGIVVHNPEGRVCLLHASLRFKRVEVSKRVLSQYLDNIHSDTGIIVLRAQEP